MHREWVGRGACIYKSREVHSFSVLFSSRLIDSSPVILPWPYFLCRLLAAPLPLLPPVRSLSPSLSSKVAMEYRPIATVAETKGQYAGKKGCHMPILSCCSSGAIGPNFSTDSKNMALPVLAHYQYQFTNYHYSTSICLK